MTDYLATNVHMGVPSATAVLFSFGVGCTTGTITGGKLGQYLYKKDKRLQGWLMAGTVWFGMLPMFCLFATRLPLSLSALDKTLQRHQNPISKALGEAHPVIFHLGSVWRLSVLHPSGVPCLETGSVMQGSQDTVFRIWRVFCEYSISVLGTSGTPRRCC